VSTVDVALQVGATGHLVSLTQRAETRITTVDR
jgi:Tfp pilus assembly pilus retraction ATPase PilT